MHAREEGRMAERGRARESETCTGTSNSGYEAKYTTFANHENFGSIHRTLLLEKLGLKLSDSNMDYLHQMFLSQLCLLLLLLMGLAIAASAQFSRLAKPRCHVSQSQSLYVALTGCVPGTSFSLVLLLLSSSTPIPVHKTARLSCPLH